TVETLPLWAIMERFSRERFLMKRSIALLLLSATAALAADEPQPQAHKVAAGPLALTVEREGRVDAADRAKVRVVPAAFGGPLVVAEVFKDAGPVTAGEPILRLDPSFLEDELRAAREAAD